MALVLNVTTVVFDVLALLLTILVVKKTQKLFFLME